MKMKRGQEQACLDNIQSYLDRIEWLEGDSYFTRAPVKRCSLCTAFRGKNSMCGNCPLGPVFQSCGHGLKANLNNGYLMSGNDWKNATIPQLKTRMRWLLKKYKKAGLEIEIV